MPSQPAPPVLRGRFAPSPTGQLHFGSLVAAVGSLLSVRSRGGVWLVRIEDIDPPREVAGAAREQLQTLARFGMVPDEPVARQRDFAPRHQAALDTLLAGGQAFPCGCSRRDLPAGGIYPGTCRDGLPPGRQARSIRLRVDDEPIEFIDRVHGRVSQNPARQTGDFVIRRADGLVAYQLAVVVDDAAAGITEVVRGSDLIDSTARQIHVYRCLNRPLPEWLHLPLIVDENGDKLSKSRAADPVNQLQPEATLRLALRALNHEPSASARTLDALWSWALKHWDEQRIGTDPVAVGVHPG